MPTIEPTAIPSIAGAINLPSPAIIDAIDAEYRDALTILAFWDEDEKSEVSDDLPETPEFDPEDLEPAAAQDLESAR